MSQFIGIEAGGTKFVLVRGTGPDDIHDRTVIETKTPGQTMPEVYAYIRDAQSKADIKAIGAAVFGPLDLNKLSKTYGHITTTPKKPWHYYDFVGALKAEFGLPVGFDTDVNAAALAEYRWGAAKGITDLLYITVGTGIGAGAMVAGELLHGAMHPEMGHMLIPQDREIDDFTGVCPYHHNCLEGLASGPSMKERWKVESALELPEDHEAWDIEAHYLATALSIYTLVLSPQRIVMGGGVMRQKHLLAKIRPKVIELINGYVTNPTLDDLDNYIVAPNLGEDVGVLGAIALGERSLL